MGQVLTLNWLQSWAQRQSSAHRRMVGARQGAGARKRDSFWTMGSSSKILRQRKTGSKIHPILSRNRPSPSLPPAVSTYREAERFDGKRLEQRGGSRQRGTSNKRDVGMLAELLQSYQTLCHAISWSPPGSSAHGILRARVLEWGAISFSRASSRPRDWICISCIGRRVL